MNRTACIRKLNIIKEKIEKHKFLSLFLFVVILNMVLFLWARSNWDFYYTMNDDIRMKSILSGELSGSPDGHVLFIRYLLTAPLSLLYTIMPNISWYNIMLVGTIFLSLVMICYRIFRIKLTYKRLFFHTFGYIIFFIIFVLKNIIYPQFTVTAGFASMAVVVVLLTYKRNSNTKTFIIDLFLVILFTYLGIAIRSNVFYMLIIFAAIPLCIDFIKYREGFKYLLITGSAICCIVVTTQVIEDIAYRSPEYKEYKEYNRARALVYDYLQFPEYNANYDFYKEHNTDTVVYDLLKEYSIRLDSRIDTDFLLDMQQYQNDRFPKDKDKLLHLPRDMCEKTFTNTYTIVIVTSYLLFSFSTLYMFIRRKYYLLSFYNISISSMVFAEIAYFVFTNRFPERVLVPLILTASLSQYILCLFVWNKHGIPNVMKLKKDMISMMKVFVGCAIISYLSGMALQNITEMKEEKMVAAAETTYIDYAQQHPDNYYYNDAEFYTGRLQVTLMENTTSLRNFMPDGGWGSGHPLLKENLSAFSLNSMEEALLTDNVYFLSKKPVHYIENYYAYQGNIVIATIVDKITGTDIDVYKFEKKEIVETYNINQKVQELYAFQNDDLANGEQNTTGIMLEIDMEKEGNIEVSLEGQASVSRILYKGVNYVFYPYRKHDTFKLNLGDEATATVNKVVVY